MDGQAQPQTQKYGEMKDTKHYEVDPEKYDADNGSNSQKQAPTMEDGKARYFSDTQAESGTDLRQSSKYNDTSEVPYGRKIGTIERESQAHDFDLKRRFSTSNKQKDSGKSDDHKQQKKDTNDDDQQNKT